MAEKPEFLTPDSDNPTGSNIQTSNSSERINSNASESASDKRKQSKAEVIPTEKRRRSFLQRQITNFERELTFDKINKRLSLLFGQVDEDEYEEPEDSESRQNTLSSSMAAVFIVSLTTGTAMRQLPHALMESSWFGVFIVILFCLNSLYGGLCTAWSWVIMEEQWPQYLKDTRIPYQDLGYRAVGTWMKYFIGICVDITLLSIGAVYIITISAAVETVANRYIDFCPTLIISSFILMPFMLFSSYKNMKSIAIFDLLASLLYCFLVIISLFLDKKQYGGKTVYTGQSSDSVALGFAAISFAYGGGAVYPSIMADMTDRSEFSHSCGTAYLIVLILYSLIAILGYAAYGDSTPQNIIQFALMNNKLFGLALTVEIIFILQVGCTFAISTMPTMLSFEERLNCPDKFCLFRIAIRLSIVTILMLLVLGLPFLPKFVDFVGATFMNFLSFVFPPIFYVCLVFKKESRVSKGDLSKKDVLMVIEMLFLAILMGIISTYASLREYAASETNRESCYFNFSSKKQLQ